MFNCNKMWSPEQAYCPNQTKKADPQKLEL